MNYIVNPYPIESRDPTLCFEYLCPGGYVPCTPVVLIPEAGANDCPRFTCGLCAATTP